MIGIVGVLVFTRGFNFGGNKDKDTDNSKPTIKEPVEEKDDSSKEEDSSNSNVVVIGNETTKEKETYPVISLDDLIYTIELGNEFILPEIPLLDELGNELNVVISYMFKSFLGDSYHPVAGIDTSVLGVYKVLVEVTNSYNLTSSKEVIVMVVDDVAPVIEVMAEYYNSDEDITEFIPVENNSIVNNSLTFNFSDNHLIAYVEYYKAKYEWVMDTEVLEEEGMQEIITLDTTDDLYLYEDGEYHVRAYDVSGNTTEFVVTIDRSNPSVSVNYEQISDTELLVTIVSNEKLRLVDGFSLSADELTLTKIYNNSIDLDIELFDLAGNDIAIHLEYEMFLVKITQDGVDVINNDLNSNGGDIKLEVIGDITHQITYTIDGGEVLTYTNGDILVSDCYYEISVVTDDFTFQITFSISSMGDEN